MGEMDGWTKYKVERDAGIKNQVAKAWHGADGDLTLDAAGNTPSFIFPWFSSCRRGQYSSSASETLFSSPSRLSSSPYSSSASRSYGKSFRQGLEYAGTTFQKDAPPILVAGKGC